MPIPTRLTNYSAKARTLRAELTKHVFPAKARASRKDACQLLRDDETSEEQVPELTASIYPFDKRQERKLHLPTKRSCRHLWIS